MSEKLRSKVFPLKEEDFDHRGKKRKPQTWPAGLLALLAVRRALLNSSRAMSTEGKLEGLESLREASIDWV